MWGGPGGERPLQGGPGPDRIWGRSGNDRLFGDADSDRIWPGRGADKTDAGFGDDRIVVRADGDPDAIECGPGHDVVVYRVRSEATDELSGCEHVIVRP
ncbi:hypothetical protein [Nocardioides sp. URHA0032]|uniref:hypothetical protein n=1 Tax=Nocardioides sp. URHA0032 TaxID=1380388 RepID=UPI000685C6EB